MQEQQAIYDYIEEIIDDLWYDCLELEAEYYMSQDKETLIRFSVCISLIQYWEEILYSLGGHYAFTIHF